ncbi:MAG TPA: DUF1858 domain-containing protein [Epulopiscium sp.]|nr:DUF1858 domain-containing protein [Candidatus Epulonipiscium sp.]
MNKHLKLDNVKIEKITNILVSYLRGEISLLSATETVNNSFDKITAQEFALCEQSLDRHAVDNDDLTKRIQDVISIVKDKLVTNELDLEEGHPIDTYLKEVKAFRNVLDEMGAMKSHKFIKNKWLELYDQLLEIKVHFSRKQNQLYSALEKKGFDKPTKIMWTLDDYVEKTIKTALNHLKNDEDDDFLNMQDDVIDIVEDMMGKEEDILYPTAIDMLSDDDFVEMRIGDDEIGYALIETPPSYGTIAEKSHPSNQALLNDLKGVLLKHGALGNIDVGQELDVSQGKLTLEQINLIFKHMQVDLSYVDENDISKFYTDTKHRVFPRSPGVIGRHVHNCHPKESVEMVDQIISAFRSGEQDEAEFWIDMGDKFIYIVYNAVRDENGQFRGVLEMMQDATRIRSLTGSQRLLSWTNDKPKKENSSKEASNIYNITSETIIGDLINDHPYIKDFLMGLSPKYEKLKNPVVFKMMSKVASLDIISERGDMTPDVLISKIVERINAEK